MTLKDLRNLLLGNLLKDRAPGGWPKNRKWPKTVREKNELLISLEKKLKLRKVKINPLANAIAKKIVVKWKREARKETKDQVSDRTKSKYFLSTQGKSQKELEDIYKSLNQTGRWKCGNCKIEILKNVQDDIIDIAAAHKKGLKLKIKFNCIEAVCPNCGAKNVMCYRQDPQEVLTRILKGSKMKIDLDKIKKLIEKLVEEEQSSLEGKNN